MSDQTKLNIKPATEEDFKTVRDITIQTISKIYPHYYPGGVVDFFLNHHSDSSIRDDIMKKNR